MTSSPRWHRFFHTDWLSRANGLTPAERGVLITLVSLMFDRGGALPRDDARLARHCGMPTAGFRRALTVLIDQRALAELDGLVSADWVEMEIKSANEKAEAASRSANARWSEKPNKNKGSDDANALRAHSDGISERNATQNKNNTPIGPEGHNARQIDLSGSSREIGHYTAQGINREASLTVACHRCGSPPGNSCVGTDGKARVRPHIERYQLIAKHRETPQKADTGQFPVVRQGDPLVPFLEQVRGRVILWGNRSSTTATPAEIEQAKALAGAA